MYDEDLDPLQARLIYDVRWYDKGVRVYYSMQYLATSRYVGSTKYV